MSGPRVLVAGIGNLLLGDDGFGVEVVRHLHRAPAPEGVAVVDYGVRGMHLAYDLYGAYDDVVMVDAVGHGNPPGTVSVLDLSGPDPSGPAAGTGHDADGTPPPLPVPTSAAVTAAAVPRSGAPAAAPLDAHGMQPQAVLDLLELLGGTLGRVLLVGCEPASLDHRIGLTPPVARAVRPAADAARSLAQSLVPKEAHS